MPFLKLKGEFLPENLTESERFFVFAAQNLVEAVVLDQSDLDERYEQVGGLLRSVAESAYYGDFFLFYATVKDFLVGQPVTTNEDVVNAFNEMVFALKNKNTH